MSPPRLAMRCVLGVLALICAVGLWRVFAGIGVHVPLDPNEGWNAYHATAAMTGGPLYPPPTAYLVNNYPPLSYYVVGFASLLTGDAIIAGRIVSLLAFFAIAAGLFMVSRRMGAAIEAAVLAPLIFCSALLLFTDYVGMDDPQMLAHALSLAGLLVLLMEPHTAKNLGAAALLFVCGVFVKHNVVALPAAATLWLIVTERRNGLILAGFGIGAGLAGLLLFRLVFGINLLAVVATARTYSFDVLVANLFGWFRWTGVLFAGLGALLYFRRSDPGVLFCTFYVLIATAIGAFFLGGGGVDWNVLFEADMALALTAALAVSRLEDWPRPIAALVLAGPLIFFGATNHEWLDTNLQRHPFAEDSAVARQDIAFMAAQKGPAICEMLSFCYWAGKPPAVDVFNIGQAFETGARNTNELVSQIEAKHFAVIQFDPDSPYSLGEDVHDAMEKTYRVHHADGYGTFYVPR